MPPASRTIAADNIPQLTDRQAHVTHEPARNAARDQGKPGPYLLAITPAWTSPGHVGCRGRASGVIGHDPSRDRPPARCSRAMVLSLCPSETGPTYTFRRPKCLFPMRVCHWPTRFQPWRRSVETFKPSCSRLTQVGRHWPHRSRRSTDELPLNDQLADCLRTIHLRRHHRLPLAAVFTGTATITTTNSSAPGRIHFACLDGLIFDGPRTFIGITSFPSIATAPYQTPVGMNVTTVTKTGGGQGSYAGGAISMPLSLHFDQSLDIIFYEEDSNLSLVLSTNLPGSPVGPGGARHVGGHGPIRRWLPRWFRVARSQYLE